MGRPGLEGRTHGERLASRFQGEPVKGMGASVSGYGCFRMGGTLTAKDLNRHGADERREVKLSPLGKPREVGDH